MQQYMVIEHFHPGAEQEIDARFKSQGRLLPAGLFYLDSWREKRGAEQEKKQVIRCFQLMQTAQAELFDIWISRWSDLCDFEVIPLQECP